MRPEQLDQALGFYRVGFWIALGMTLLFLGIALFMFFRYKIPYIFKMRTGLAMKKSVSETQQDMLTTGRLRRANIAMGSRTNSLKEERRLAMQAPPQEETEVLESNDTVVLDYLQVQTNVLQEDTVVLAGPAANETLPPVKEPLPERMTLVHSTVPLHTNEVL